MIFVTYYFAYWRHDLDPMTDTKHVMIPIYRIRGVPTQEMIQNNISRWSAGWNLTSSEPNSGLFLVENGMPINFATLIVSFFATSAVFHFFALIAGAFERFWFIYWRQLDDASGWWCAQTFNRTSQQHTRSVRTLFLSLDPACMAGVGPSTQSLLP